MVLVATVALNTRHYRSTYENTRFHRSINTENAMCRLLMPGYRFLHAQQAEYLYQAVSDLILLQGRVKDLPIVVEILSSPKYTNLFISDIYCIFSLLHQGPVPSPIILIQHLSDILIFLKNDISNRIGAYTSDIVSLST